MKNNVKLEFYTQQIHLYEDEIKTFAHTNTEIINHQQTYTTRNAKESPQAKGKQNQMKIWIYTEEWRAFEMPYAINFTALLQMRKLRFRKVQWPLVNNSTTIRTHTAFPRHRSGSMDYAKHVSACPPFKNQCREIAFFAVILWNDHFWEPTPMCEMIHNLCSYLSFHWLIPLFFDVCPISNYFKHLFISKHLYKK